MASASSVTAPVSFNIAFERLRDIVNKDDLRSFNSTTMQDVWTTARDIERHLESRRSLRGFHRIQPFLAGIEQYSKVVEVICQGTPYLPYIWAPIKLLLQISQGHISALEKLIDAYAMIGEAMPRFDRLSAAFIDDPEFQHVMGHFYEDILEFHRRAYMFFRRRSWKLVFDSLWKSFNLRFNGILESLRKHRDLIDQEANAISIAEAKAWRNIQLDQIRQWRAERTHDIDKQERERLASHTRETVAWFGASEDQEDHYTRISKACDGTEGHWALKEPSIVSWLDQNRDNPVMWLNGKPGAGKSVICAKLIEHIQEKTKTVAIFYFFSHSQNFQKNATEVLRSFATQLLAANTDLAPYILENFANNGQRATKKNLGIILEKMITSLPAIRLVIDGLDECPQNEQDEVIEDLLKIRSPIPGACKVLVSSRKYRTISRLLQTKPTFRLDDNAQNVNNTIASFVQPRLYHLRNRFDPDIIDELGRQLLSKANGMFLWVKLIMFTLEDLHFESDVREVIKTLPEDLESVYERILLRVCGDGKTPNQRRAIRILQWMLLAQRPLKRSELESGIVLDQRVLQITAADRPQGDVLSLCHPILDADDDPGGTVSFVHFTAREYIQKSGVSPSLRPQRAQLTVALSCVLYLPSSLDLVDPRCTEYEIRSRIGQGFHDLHLYANDYWLDHLQALLDSPAGTYSNEADLVPLREALERLAITHNELAALKGWKSKNENDLALSPGGNIWRSPLISPAVERLLDDTLAYRKDAPVNNGLNASSYYNDSDPTLFSTIRARYQSIVEEILGSEQVAEKTLSDFKARHSAGAFLCRYRNCPRAAQGFNTLELRQAHEESHASKFRCEEATCGFFGWPFHTRAAIKKHTAQYHNEERTAIIPDSLGNPHRRSQQDKSLFTLKAHYSVDESQTRKSALNGHTGISIEKQDVWVSDEPAPVRESVHAQQALHLATEDSSVTDVESHLADLRLEELSADLKQEHDDWHVMYNPSVQRRTSLELVHDMDQSGYVTSLCFSPDDTLIALATEGGISIFDMPTGALVKSLGEHLLSIDVVQFSPSGNLLAFCSSVGPPLGIWDIAKSSPTRFGNSGRNVRTIQYSTDGELLASVDGGGAVKVWSVRIPGQVALQFKIPGGIWMRHCAFSPDCSMLAALSDDRSIWIWDVQNGSLVSQTNHCDTGFVTSVAFHTDSKRLVSVNVDSTVAVWNVEASTSGDYLKKTLTLKGRKAQHPGYLRTATLPHSSRILSGSVDGVFQLWDHDTREAILLLKSYKCISPSYREPRIAASNSGELFATTGNMPEKVRVWKICPYKQHQPHPTGTNHEPNSSSAAPSLNTHTATSAQTTTGSVPSISAHSHDSTSAPVNEVEEWGERFPVDDWYRL